MSNVSLKIKGCWGQWKTTVWLLWSDKFFYYLCLFELLLFRYNTFRCHIPMQTLQLLKALITMLMPIPKS